ncbi:O-antigen ligase family protein [Thomasclavelia cocleata]|uniref:O-antigen ligase family protein n=1 Tax=Thomasclavelia cocleata TaxID=69824 RepID=UPI0025580430|nr:O-antigen ligase family protein [Thomasclavelia cocleata]
MSILTLIVGTILFLIGIILFMKLNTCYYPVCFFFIKFIAGRIMDFERVRNQVSFQLIILFFIILIVIFKDKEVLTIKDLFFYRIILLSCCFLFLNIVLGLIDGHSWFQVLIDSYKYIEIFVFYFLFRICWKDNIALFKGIRAFCYFMISAGIIEIFITSRGGVGLNLIMSLFPMIVLLALNGYIKCYKIIVIVSIIVVVICQTRTYIIGFIIGFVMMLKFLSKEKRTTMLNFLFLLGIITVIVFSFTNTSLFSDTISRFLELSEGFDESGGYRIDEYIIAIEKFIERPIFGNGFGYLQYMYIGKMGWMNWGDFIHCMYIEILFKTGVIGLISIFIIIGSFISKIVQQMKYFRKQDEFIFAICCGGLCSFITWGVTYTFAPLTTYGSMFVGVIIASIALSNYYNESKKVGVKNEV